MSGDIRQFDSSAEAASAAAHFLIEQLHRIQESRSVHEPVSVVLPGGSAPRLLNSALLKQLGEVDTRRISWFFGDERAVATESDYSNYRMQMESLLEPLNTEGSRIHRIPGELGAVKAAVEYEQDLKRFFNGSPVFDIVILGLGPDGHTASLFPGGPNDKHMENPVIAVAAPSVEPRVERVTITFPVINSAKTVIFFTGRSGKETVVNHLLKPGDDSSGPEYPFEHVRPISGPAIWFVYGNEK